MAKSTETSREENKDFKAEDYFFTSNGIDSVAFVFDEEPNAVEPIKETYSVFCSNLLGAVLTAMSFSVFSAKCAYDAGYHGMLGVALATKTGVVSSTEEMIQKARRGLAKDLEKPEWSEKLKTVAETAATAYLESFLSDEIGRNIASRITNQCAVFLWSAFEVLASDLFVQVLNTQPQLAGALLKDARTKNLYRAKDLGDALEEYKYDLSHHMGEALVRQARLDDLGTIKAVYGVLLGGSDRAREALDQKDLWRLCKIRNMIVHRAGIVDEQFRKETGIDVAVGSRFRVTPAELDGFAILVEKAEWGF